MRLQIGGFEVEQLQALVIAVTPALVTMVKKISRNGSLL